jgi:hypothetical protein
MYKTLLTTSHRSTRVWYHSLEPGFIIDLHDLCIKFISCFSTEFQILGRPFRDCGYCKTEGVFFLPKNPISIHFHLKTPKKLELSKINLST